MKSIRSFAAAAEKHRGIVFRAEEELWRHPETGFKEQFADRYLSEAFEALGYRLRRADGIPGFYTVIDTGRAGPEILVLGEMDSVLCPSHPAADPKTGAAHACGHHVQGAALLGVAAALREEGMLDGLCGRIRLCAVPAEELIETDERKEKVKKGTIKYLGGKAEFLYRGYFDGADIALMSHASAANSVSGGCVGVMLKKIVYKGKATHACNPWAGVNALNAALCGLNAANAVRDRFKESDIVRFHPIVTCGGQVVNAVPDRVEIEAYVRGRTYEVIHEANDLVNRALIGGALSLGAGIEIEDDLAYSPRVTDRGLAELAGEALRKVLPEEKIAIYDAIESGSSDLGHLGALMPALTFFCRGATGTGHGADFEIIDRESSCIHAAKWTLALLYMLLEKDAARAKEIVAAYKPTFRTKEELFAFLDGCSRSGDRIRYTERGAEVEF